MANSKTEAAETTHRLGDEERLVESKIVDEPRQVFNESGGAAVVDIQRKAPTAGIECNAAAVARQGPHPLPPHPMGAARARGGDHRKTRARRLVVAENNADSCRL